MVTIQGRDKSVLARLEYSAEVTQQECVRLIKEESWNKALYASPRKLQLLLSLLQLTINTIQVSLGNKI